MTNQTHAIHHPPLIRTDGAVVIASGFLATLAMTTIMYTLPLLRLGQVDAPLWAARLFLGNSVLAMTAGVTLHLFLGVAFARLYASRVEPLVSVGPAISGLLFGASLWAFAQVVAVPALGALAGAAHTASSVSPGFLSFRLGLDGAVASLAAHLAYGAVLGTVYGCLARGQCVGGRCR